MLNDADLYDADYFNTRYYDTDQARYEMYRQEIKRIVAKVPQGRILDVGCGTGGFLQAFDDRWERYGVEPSPYAANIARAKGVNVTLTMPTFESWNEYFDVIVFRGTIQHINTPLQDIQRAYEMLKAGGVIVFLATPNTGGIIYRLFQDLPPLDAPRNWCLFSDKTLCNILTRLGFVRQEVIYPYLDTPYARPFRDLWRFFLRFFGVKKPFAFWGNMMEVYTWKPG